MKRFRYSVLVGQRWLDIAAGENLLRDLASITTKHPDFRADAR